MEPGRAAFVGRIDAAIPDDHFARAVLPGRNHAFERGVVVRVVLGLHGEALFARIERRALGNRPGLEDAVAFEAEVVVQVPGGMLLDDEQQRPAARLGEDRRGLGRRVEGALGRVFGQGASGHAGILGSNREMDDKSSRILAGASGYSFKEWKGNFYPEKMKPEEMLAFYSERLPTVEINNTFYRMPKTADARELGGDDARGLPVRDQGVAAHHAHVAHQGGVVGRAARLSLPEPRGARRQARPGALPAAAEPEEGRAAPRRVPRAAAQATTAPRSNSATTHGSTTKSTRR